MAGHVDSVLQAVADASDWGPWTLGDVVDVARRAAEFLGSGTPVQRIAVEAPADGGALPKVVVVVRDADAVAMLGERVAGSENEAPARFCGNSFGGGWIAELDAIEVHVATDPGVW